MESQLLKVTQFFYPTSPMGTASGHSPVEVFSNATFSYSCTAVGNISTDRASRGPSTTAELLIYHHIWSTQLNWLLQVASCLLTESLAEYLWKNATAARPRISSMWTHCACESSECLVESLSSPTPSLMDFYSSSDEARSLSAYVRVEGPATLWTCVADKQYIPEQWSVVAVVCRTVG